VEVIMLLTREACYTSVRQELPHRHCLCEMQALPLKHARFAPVAGIVLDSRVLHDRVLQSHRSHFRSICIESLSVIAGWLRFFEHGHGSTTYRDPLYFGGFADGR
jgi:hypothetical protein